MTGPSTLELLTFGCSTGGCCLTGEIATGTVTATAGAAAGTDAVLATLLIAGTGVTLTGTAGTDIGVGAVVGTGTLLAIGVVATGTTGMRFSCLLSFSTCRKRFVH
jgi:hypothetical protein